MFKTKIKLIQFISNSLLLVYIIILLLLLLYYYYIIIIILLYIIQEYTHIRTHSTHALTTHQPAHPTQYHIAFVNSSNREISATLTTILSINDNSSATTALASGNVIDAMWALEGSTGTGKYRLQGGGGGAWMSTFRDYLSSWIRIYGGHVSLSFKSTTKCTMKCTMKCTCTTIYLVDIHSVNTS